MSPVNPVREKRASPGSSRFVTPCSTMTYFRDSGRFANLDISLASALKRIVTGDLGREVMNRSTA